MADETPDYAAMSGAEFQRAAGADPEKWATAFCGIMQRSSHNLPYQLVLDWFRDAMDAACREGMRLGRIGEGQ